MIATGVSIVYAGIVLMVCQMILYKAMNPHPNSWVFSYLRNMIFVSFGVIVVGVTVSLIPLLEWMKANLP